MNPATRLMIKNIADLPTPPISVPQLAQILGLLGLGTGYGTPYDPNGRGLYRAIHCSYDHYVAIGDQQGADRIAEKFIKADGTYAYQ